MYTGTCDIILNWITIDTRVYMCMWYRFTWNVNLIFKSFLIWFKKKTPNFQFYSWRRYKQKNSCLLEKKYPSYTALTHTPRCFLYKLFISYQEASDPFKQVNINDIVIIRWEIASYVKRTVVHSIFAMTVLYLIIFYWKIEARNGDLRVSNGYSAPNRGL